MDLQYDRWIDYALEPNKQELIYIVHECDPYGPNKLSKKVDFLIGVNISITIKSSTTETKKVMSVCC